MKGKITSVGVDWLSGTTLSDPKTANLIAYILRLVFADEVQRPLTWPFVAHGFRGSAVDGARWGIRQEMGLVQLSGALSSEHWRAIVSQVDNVTRVDYQVTVALEKPNVHLADLGYESVLERDAYRATLISSGVRGSTLYVGSRQSRYFGRLYDKGASLGGQPGLLWRYEVEIKKPQAVPEIEALLAAQDEHKHIAGFVHTWFDRRGCEPIFPPTVAIDAIETPKNLTNDEKVLQWLRKQVKPAVGRLLVAGRGGEVLEALGIPVFNQNNYSDQEGIDE